MTESMKFEWDPAKAEVNRRKHGVPFLKQFRFSRTPLEPKGSMIRKTTAKIAG